MQCIYDEDRVPAYAGMMLGAEWRFKLLLAGMRLAMRRKFLIAYRF